MIKQRDLLLVPFPFSDQSGRKVRPVVVVSNDDFNDYSEDVLIVGVTSNVSKGKYIVSLLDNELDEGKLFLQKWPWQTESTKDNVGVLQHNVN